MECSFFFEGCYNFVVYFGLLSLRKSMVTRTVCLVLTSRADAFISVSPKSILALISRIAEGVEEDPAVA